MYKKLMLTLCVTTLITTACAKRENPLINPKAIALLSSMVADGMMPGDCREYFLNTKNYPSRQASCEKKADTLFEQIKGKEPFLQATLDDVKDQKFWQEFYKQKPNFDFFYS